MSATGDTLSARGEPGFVLGLMAWCALAWSLRSMDGAYAFGALCLLGWWWVERRRAGPVSWPMGLLPAAALALGILLIGFAMDLAFSELPLGRVFERNMNWIGFLYAVPLALLLLRYRAHHAWFFLLPAMAVAARVLGHLDWAQPWQSLVAKGFKGFGMHHVDFGFQAAMSLLALLAAAPLALERAGRWRVPALLALLALAGLIGQALFSCGSRAGVAVFLLGAGLLCLRLMLRRRSAWPPLVALAVLVPLVAINGDMLHQRFVGGVSQLPASVFSLDSYPRDEDVFVGRRLYLKAYGFSLWEEKPWWGHRPGNVYRLLDRDPDFAVHSHLHDSYIETLVELGVLGAGSLFLFVLVSAVHAVRRGRCVDDQLSKDLLYAMVPGVVLWSSINVGLHGADVRFLYNWLLALALMLALRGAACEPAEGEGG